MDCRFIFRPIDTWPHQKTRSPKRAQFRSRYDDTLNLLAKELCNINVKQAVIQLDLPESKIKTDGTPYSTARPVFQGVILSFESKFGHLKYATDTFDFWQDNIRAIALGLKALRAVDRYGITKRGEQYTGWKALPENIDGITDIHKAAEFISEHSGYSAGDIACDKNTFEQAYRAAARKLHPDKGGNTNDFNLLQKAKRLLMQ